MHVAIPTSLIFKKLRILFNVPVSPTNSVPKQSKKIRREKNAINIVFLEYINSRDIVFSG